MKRTIIALALALVPALASAADTYGGPPLPEGDFAPVEFDAAASNTFPDVVVRSVDIDETFFQAGQTVRGTFRAFNPTQNPADATFEVGLVGGFDENGNPTAVYAVDVSNPSFSLPAGEERLVEFELALPSGLDGAGLKVQVQTRLVDSVYRGWGFSDGLTVEGDGRFAVVDGAYFRLPSGETASPEEGPFVYPGETLALVSELRSQGSAVTVRARLEATNRGTGESVSFSAEPVVVAAGAEADVVVNVPAGGQKPGVYEGLVRFVGEDGRDRATPVNLRYIVAGEAATVHSAVASSDSVRRGDALSIELAVSGSPVDVRREPEDGQGAGSAGRVEVTVVDASGAEVASGAIETTLLGVQIVHFDFEAERAAETMTVEARVYGSAGQLLYERSLPLLGSGSLAAPEDAGGWNRPLVSRAVAFLALAAALLGATFLLWRRNSRASAATLALLALVATGVATWPLVTLAVKATRTSHVSSYNVTVTEQSIGGGHPLCPVLVNPPSIYVNNPNPDGEEVQCNSTLAAEGSVSYVYCSNAGSYGTTYAWIVKQAADGSWAQVGGTQSTTNFQSGATGGHTHPFVWRNFAFSFNGLTEEGNYRLYVRAHSATACPTIAAGYRSFEVTGCDQCLNLPGNQSSVPMGMTKDAGGNCSCPSGSELDPIDGRCEDDDGNCTTCGGDCGDGRKYCDGVCIDEDESCDTTVVDQCVFVPDGDQYCVEVFDRDGNRTDQFAGYTNEDLEEMFGYGLRQAVEAQQAAIAIAGQTYPVLGVVGRVISGAGSVDANYESAGCAGALCAYGEQGCLTTVDPTTNRVVGNCCPVNDATGGGKEPSASLEVEPSVVGQGGVCEVFWSSHEMVSCQVSGQGVSSTAIAGAADTSPLYQSATYTITCTGLDGETYVDSDTCAVDPDVTEF